MRHQRSYFDEVENERRSEHVVKVKVIVLQYVTQTASRAELWHQAHVAGIQTRADEPASSDKTVNVDGSAWRYRTKTDTYYNKKLAAIYLANESKIYPNFTSRIKNK